MKEFLESLNLSDSLFLRLAITIILFILNPYLKYVARKFVKHVGLLTSKTQLRIDHISQLICILINISFIVTLGIIWGVDPDKIIIVFSSVFTVIGVALFAQWSILSNITSGIVIFFSMPFRIGDEIEILDKDYPIKATVENVLAFAIHLRTENGDLVVMSNTQFMQKTFSIKEPKTQTKSEV